MLFYCTNISYPYCTLSEEETNHMVKVLRMKKNETLKIVNGKGLMFEGIIEVIEKKEVIIKLQKKIKEEFENPNKLSIAICPPKNPARLEWFLEKATEIGIDQIFPIISERTEKETIKQERLQQIIISASKQSGQLFFPTFHPIQPLKTIVNSTSLPFENYFIAHCEDNKSHLKNVYRKNESALLLIGPEGDFTKVEIQSALNKNYIPVSLGSSILRVETAGVVACSIIQLLNFD